MYYFFCGEGGRFVQKVQLKQTPRPHTYSRMDDDEGEDDVMMYCILARSRPSRLL